LDYYSQVLPIPNKVCVKDKYDPAQNYELVCTKHETRWFDLGNSIIWKYDKPITKIVGERFPLSFKFSIVSLVIAYMISYPLGVYMARNHGKLGDKIGNAYVIVNIAVPPLVFYYLWNIFGMKILNFPSIYDPTDPRSWVMPLWALSFAGTGSFAMVIRRFMVDERNSDYVKFARSKGLSEKRIMYVHVLRNAIVPLIRNIPAALIFTIQGSYFVEMLWTIPGSGFLLITALTKGDNPLVLGLVIIYASLSMFAILLGDLITVFMDPRISLTKNK
jgi:oligopeptide transport system permease protein